MQNVGMEKRAAIYTRVSRQEMLPWILSIRYKIRVWTRCGVMLMALQYAMENEEDFSRFCLNQKSK